MRYKNTLIAHPNIALSSCSIKTFSQSSLEFVVIPIKASNYK